MNKEQTIDFKQAVHDFWDEKTCGTWEVDKEKFTKEYFEEIEETRYRLQPEIFTFAEFTRFHGKKVLEVGVGAGTDFLQWVRAGADASGIDLTEQAIEHVRHRLELYNLKPGELHVSDCEQLPFPDNFFDLVYSWGVIHHTPDTKKALDEIVRVCKPGGICKIMIYHRNSLLAWFFWIKRALLKGKPFQTISKVLSEQMESYGTKAYTVSEAKKILEKYNLYEIRIQPVLTYYDKLERQGGFLSFIAKSTAWLLGGDRVGWFLTIQFKKRG